MLAFEQEAVRITAGQLGAVPGLPQTERYARSVIQAGRPKPTTQRSNARSRRAWNGSRSSPATEPHDLWYVVHEAVLRHVIGDQEIMGEQLDKLIKAANLRGIVLQVLPFTAHDHAGVEGPITIYE